MNEAGHSAASARQRHGYRLVAKALLVWVAGWLAASPGWLAPADARAEVRQVELVYFPLQAGVEIVFATHQQAINELSYETRVAIVDVWDGGVEFTYAMTHAQGTTKGTSIITDREGCTALDPWWGGTTPALRSQRCDLWISRQAYRALWASREAPMNPDLTVRGDVGVQLALDRRDIFRCRVDGVMRDLPVLVATSSVGDEVWVYDNPQNPFVLQSFITGAYAWFVTDIYVATEAPRTPATLVATPAMRP